MAYNRPPWWFRSLFNPVARTLGLGGTVTLRVRGRSSGKVQAIPVMPVTVDGERYLVSTRGESTWVRNLRAADGQADIVTRGKVEPVLATELPVAERGPVLAAYRDNAGRVVDGYFQKLPDDDDHPTFRLTPAG